MVQHAPEQRVVQEQLRQAAAELGGNSAQPRERIELIPNDPAHRADRFWERPRAPSRFWSWLGVGIVWLLSGIVAYLVGLGAVYLWTVER